MGPRQYTSFQIGKMLQVSRQAVNQWIDKGYIKSYRTPGGHRRVLREELLKFLEQRNIPIPPDLLEEAEAGAKPPLIIVIDDEQDFLTLISKALTKAIPEVRVLTYPNGLDGLIAIGIERPSVLVLDLNMPGMDGAEVCRRLKANPLTQDVPIVVVTGYAPEELPRRMRSLPVERYCTKSLSIDELVRQIAEFLPGVQLKETTGKSRSRAR